MTTVPDKSLRRFPFFPGPYGGEPREYTERRVSCPFGRVRLRDGREATLALRYEDVSAALTDERFTHQAAEVDALGRTASSNIFTDSANIMNLPGFDRKRQRRVIAGALGPSRIEAMLPLIRQTTGTLLDAAVETGPAADLVTAFITPFPVMVMCRLLGVPTEDYPLFRDWSNGLVSAVPISAGQREALMADFKKYTRELIALKRANPGSDIIDYFIAARDDGKSMTEEEITYSIMAAIALGTNAVGNILGRITLMLLLDDRKLWEQIRAHGAFDRVVLDELLRLVQQGNAAMIKVAVEDIQLPSGTIRAGEAIALPLSSTGLDESVYPDPRTLRFDRQGPRSLIFGGGERYCLGQHVAKAMLYVGLSALMTRLPGLRLATDPKLLRFSRGELVHMLTALPVTW
jgi:cytochrome P450